MSAMRMLQPARRAMCARPRCSGRRSSPPSPTSTPATSPPTSPPGRVRIPAALGHRRGQHHRDADPVAVGEARPRDRPQPAGGLPRHLPPEVNIGLWVQAEGVAIATDLAEVIGGAVALYLLFGLPLPIGGLVTGVVAFGLLALQERGHRPFERAVAGLFA